MQCLDIRKKLNAWLDGELPAHEVARLECHLEECSACRIEADAIRQVMGALDALPVIHAPTALSGRTLRLFRSKLEKQVLRQWWQNLSPSLRGAVYGVALAGLLFGAVMGISLSASSVNTTDNPYLNLYASQGYLP